MNKIVYLFGAGASCKCLPIVRDMPERMLGFVSVLEKKEFQLDDAIEFNDLGESSLHLQKKLIEDLKWLINESSRHASIDTLAKKLYLKEDSKEIELKKLKLGLSIFLTFEQLINPPDNRYDAFFASLLSNNTRDFPKQIRILSWNYDFQFEIAYGEYSDDKRISANQSSLGIMTKHHSTSYSDDRFKIFKINGTAGLISDNGHSRYFFADDSQTSIDKKLIRQLVRNYSLGLLHRSKVYSGLSFAWEEDFLKKKILDVAIEEIKDATVLVIIGYSFPFFNRIVDRKVLAAMSHLRKVYIQDLDIKGVRQRFNAANRDSAVSELTIIPFDDVSQFLLPDEL